MPLAVLLLPCLYEMYCEWGGGFGRRRRFDSKVAGKYSTEKSVRGVYSRKRGKDGSSEQVSTIQYCSMYATSPCGRRGASRTRVGAVDLPSRRAGGVACVSFDLAKCTGCVCHGGMTNG